MQISSKFSSERRDLEAACNAQRLTIYFSKAQAGAFEAKASDLARQGLTAEAEIARTMTESLRASIRAAEEQLKFWSEELAKDV